MDFQSLPLHRDDSPSHRFSIAEKFELNLRSILLTERIAALLLILKCKLDTIFGQCKAEGANALGNVKCGKCPHKTHIQKT
jgi:hypothetical protein